LPLAAALSPWMQSSAEVGGRPLKGTVSALSTGNVLLRGRFTGLPVSLGAHALLGLLARAGIAGWRLDGEGRLTACNDAVEGLLWRPARQLEGLPVDWLGATDEARELLGSCVKQAHAGQASHGVEMGLLRGDGAVASCVLDFAPAGLKGHGGGGEGVVVAGRLTTGADAAAAEYETWSWEERHRGALAERREVAAATVGGLLRGHAARSSAGKALAHQSAAERLQGLAQAKSVRSNTTAELARSEAAQRLAGLLAGRAARERVARQHAKQQVLDLVHDLAAVPPGTADCGSSRRLQDTLQELQQLGRRMADRREREELAAQRLQGAIEGGAARRNINGRMEARRAASELLSAALKGGVDKRAVKQQLRREEQERSAKAIQGGLAGVAARREVERTHAATEARQQEIYDAMRPVIGAIRGWTARQKAQRMIARQQQLEEHVSSIVDTDEVLSSDNDFV